METVDEVVYVLDHDTRVREALCAVLRVNGKNVRAFASGNAFLACRRGGDASCLLLDMRMPDMSGLEVQNLVNREANISVVFVTAGSDVPSTVLAMKSGAIDFFIKPVEESILMAAVETVETALAKTRKLLHEVAKSAALMALYRKLTPRKRELLLLLAQGLLNTQAAGMLGITEYTVQVK